MEAFDIPALHALCIELSIPGPAAEACLAQAASAQAAPLLRHIPALLDASRAEAAMRELQAKCAPLCPNGLLELAVLLSAALEARKHYAARGVPDDVYLATMGCFSRFLNETHRWTGRWQFDRGFWVWRQLCGRLLRLGTLEFEALPLPAELAGPLGAAAGAPALSVHIPGDAMCMPETLHASYARRADFFARDGALPLTYCRTWLLSPRVKELLPPGSGIRNFMEDYTLADWDPDDNSGRLWLFGAPGIPHRVSRTPRCLSARLCSGAQRSFCCKANRSARGWGC